MKIKILLTTASVLLFFTAIPQITCAQKDGEALLVLIDEKNQQTLKFSNLGSLKLPCGFFVTKTLMENEEEALAIKVAHYHHKFEVWEWNPPNYDIGSRYLPEQGWLYITSSRIVFTVEEGDPSHAFEVKRTDLKTKPVTDLARYNFAGVQINLTERLAASNSREQKFAFLMHGIPTCRKYVTNPKPITKFLTLAINDFNAAMTEFNQRTASLHRSGRFELISIGARVNAPRVDKFTFTSPFDYDRFEQSTTIEQLSGEPNQSTNSNESEEIVNFDIAIQQNPQQWRPYLRRGEAYYRKGNYDRALADFDRAIQLSPEQPNAYYNRGLVYGRTGDHDFAIINFDKALELRPQEAVTYNARASLYARKGDYNRALVDYDRAIQLSPQLKMLYYNRGLAFARKDDFDPALADFNKEIELNPREADVYNARGCVYSYKGDYDRAITDYSEAIRLKPDFWTAYKNRARVYEMIGNTAKAQEDRNKSSELQKQKTKP